VLKNADEFIIWVFFFVAVAVSRSKRLGAIDYIVLALLGLGIISSVLSGVRPLVMGSDIVLMFKFYALFRGITLQEFDFSEFEGFLKLIYVIGFVSLGIAVFEIISPDAVKDLLWGESTKESMFDVRFGITSANSLFVHPGYYGWFMSIPTCAALGTYVITEKKSFLGLAAVFFLGMMLSMRRKPLVAVILALVLYFIFVRNSAFKIRMSTVMWVGASLVLFVVVFSDAIEELAISAINVYFVEGSFDYVARNVLYLFSVIIAIDYFPFGAGLGQFGGFISVKYYSDVYYRYGLNTVYGLSGKETDPQFAMDTFWPYILGQLGFIGLILFGLLLWLILRAVVRMMRTTSNKEIGLLGVVSFLIFWEAFFEATAMPVYSNSLIIFFVMVPLALSYTYYTNERRSRDESPVKL
jgi:hypothetical protein